MSHTQGATAMSKDRTEELSDLAEQCASHPLGVAMPEVKQAGEAIAELLATVEALKSECTGLRATEQNLREELADIKAAMSEPVAFRIFDKDPNGGKDDRWIYYSKEEFKEGANPATLGMWNLYTMKAKQ